MADSEAQLVAGREKAGEKLRLINSNLKKKTTKKIHCNHINQQSNQTNTDD